MIRILKILGRFTQRLKFLYIFLRESHIKPSRKIPSEVIANSNAPGTDLSQTQMSIYGQNVPNVHKWSCRGCLCLLETNINLACPAICPDSLLKISRNNAIVLLYFLQDPYIYETNTLS